MRMRTGSLYASLGATPRSIYAPPKRHPHIGSVRALGLRSSAPHARRSQRERDSQQQKRVGRGPAVRFQGLWFVLNDAGSQTYACSLLRITPRTPHEGRERRGARVGGGRCQSRALKVAAHGVRITTIHTNASVLHHSCSHTRSHPTRASRVTD